jgi:hypothetical protein
MKNAASVTRTRLHLAFFQTEVLGLARRCDALAFKHPNDKEFHMARVVDLWSLLHCFCQHPLDITSALPALAQTLVRAMGDTRYPQLVVSSRQDGSLLNASIVGCLLLTISLF